MALPYLQNRRKDFHRRSETMIGPNRSYSASRILVQSKVSRGAEKLFALIISRRSYPREASNQTNSREKDRWNFRQMISLPNR